MSVGLGPYVPYFFFENARKAASRIQRGALQSKCETLVGQLSSAAREAVLAEARLDPNFSVTTPSGGHAYTEAQLATHAMVMLALRSAGLSLSAAGGFTIEGGEEAFIRNLCQNQAALDKYDKDVVVAQTNIKRRKTSAAGGSSKQVQVQKVPEMEEEEAEPEVEVTGGGAEGDQTATLDQEAWEKRKHKLSKTRMRNLVAHGAGSRAWRKAPHPACVPLKQRKDLDRRICQSESDTNGSLSSYWQKYLVFHCEEEHGVDTIDEYGWSRDDGPRPPDWIANEHLCLL